MSDKNNNDVRIIPFGGGEGEGSSSNNPCPAFNGESDAFESTSSAAGLAAPPTTVEEEKAQEDSVNVVTSLKEDTGCKTAGNDNKQSGGGGATVPGAVATMPGAVASGAVSYALDESGRRLILDEEDQLFVGKTADPLAAKKSPPPGSSRRGVSYGQYWIDEDDEQAANDGEKEGNGQDNPEEGGEGRRRTGSVRASIPGAVREGGDDLAHTNASSDEIDQSDASGSIAVANMIDESDEELARQDMPQAQTVRESLEAKEKRKKEKNLMVTSFLLVIFGIVIIVAVVLVLAVALTKGGNDDDPDNNEGGGINNNSQGQGPTTGLSSTNTPSMAPTSPQDYISSILPDYTLQAIEDDPESPQGLAFDWLLEDLTYNPSLLQDPDRAIQRFSLTVFYYATGGDQWVNNNYWLDHEASECNWHSKVTKPLFLPPPPTCNVDGKFEHLGLPKNNLINALPLELFHLSHLKTLSLDLNRLEGPIPSHVGTLTKLQGLWINSLRKGGAIPTQIGSLSDLVTISLVFNQHTGIVPTEFGTLTNMKSIFMGRNPRLKGRIPDISKMPDLTAFSIDNNAQMTGTIPTQIGTLTKLNWLTVGKNRLSGSLPSQLGLLSKITTAAFLGNRFTGTIPTQVGLLESVTQLNFASNRLGGTIPSELGKLTKLKVGLNLHSNPMMGGMLPTQLGLLTKLYQFDFGNNNHTGPIPSELGMVASLGKLNFANNSLTGTIPTSLAGLDQSLFYLDVSGNTMLSGTVPEGLCDISGECVAHNHRTPCPPEGTQFVLFDCTDLLCGCDCDYCSSSSSGEGNNVTDDNLNTTMIDLIP